MNALWVQIFTFCDTQYKGLLNLREFVWVKTEGDGLARVCLDIAKPLNPTKQQHANRQKTIIFVFFTYFNWCHIQIPEAEKNCHWDDELQKMLPKKMKPDLTRRIGVIRLSVFTGTCAWITFQFLLYWITLLGNFVPTNQLEFPSF